MLNLTLYHKTGRRILGAGLLSLSLLPQVAFAGSLENMERERARLLSTLLDPGISAETRLEQSAQITNRLVDMERMVLRDKSLTEEAASPDVQTAFQNYDLTFLIHASVEKDMTVLELWLEQLDLSGNDVLAADIGRK